MSRPSIEHMTIQGLEHKRCGHCGVWKPLIHFPLDQSRHDGLGPQCRDCESTAQRKHDHARVLARRETQGRSLPAIRRWVKRTSHIKPEGF